MNYRARADISIKENEQGAFLVASRPLRTVRLNPSLLALVRRMTLEDVSPASEAERVALEALAKGGFVEKQWQAERDMESLPSVSVVIPVKDRADDLRKCLLSLAELDYPEEKIEVIVVDDGSRDRTPEVARELGAILVESGAVGGGPAVARNKGALKATGEVLAFIDSDCTASREWLLELLPAFVRDDVAAVGGWVDGMYHASSLDRYEAVMSSLNLGRRSMSGSAGGDTFYLPSCNLLVRKRAFSSAGGFRADLQVGEDVDLTWRLRDAGWTIVYLPRGAVFHAHRSRLWPFMKRRFDYGTSEGLLQQLHPGRGKKMRIPPTLAVILCLLATALVSGSLIPFPAAALLLLADTCLSKRRMDKRGLPLSISVILFARARALGSLCYYLGFHLLRYYLIPLLLAVALYPPLGLLVPGALLGVATVDHRVRRARLALPLFWSYYLFEQLAYGSGVFCGCLRLKSFASYRLSLQAD